MENLSNKFGYRMSKFNKIQKILFYAFCVILFLIIFDFLFLSAPWDFPPGAVVRIEPGMSLRSISNILERQHIIRSKVAFESAVIILGGERRIISADYLFEKKLSLWQVAERIVGVGHRMAPVSVTIPEGFDVNQIGATFSLVLKNFNKTRFLALATKLEGYLFPDTYFFSTSAGAENVVQSMSDNFKKKITPLLPGIISSGKTERDIITMASLIEREAKGDTDREVISGILWKRIAINMPLQVDSDPETYKIRGLPMNPIGNPGLLAIKAAINPQSSPYLYYLHDKNGNIHYAINFTEHSKNKLKYLQ
jgi:UPF0755 protein